MKFCPLKSSSDFREMRAVLGDDTATSVYVRNGGHPLDLAPNGKKSKLFKDLVSDLGTREAAIKAKANAFTLDFERAYGMWYNNEQSTMYDENNEPHADIVQDHIKKGPVYTSSIFTNENEKKLYNMQKSFMAKMNIKVEAIDNMKKRYGYSAIAMADLTDKTIRYAKGKLGIEALTEENAHFAIEALGKDHPTVAKVLELVEGTEKWAENSERYKEVYNGNMEKVRVEIAGQLLADAIMQKSQEAIEKENAKNPTLLNRLINLFNGIMKQVSNRLKSAPNGSMNQMVIDAYGPIANDIINGEVTVEMKENLEQATGNYAMLNPLESVGVEMFTKKGAETLFLKASRIKKEAKSVKDEEKSRDVFSKAFKVQDLIKSAKIPDAFVEVVEIMETQVENDLKAISEIKELDGTEETAIEVLDVINEVRKSASTYTPLLQEILPQLSNDEKKLHPELVSKIKNIMFNESVVLGNIKNLSYRAIYDAAKYAFESNEDIKTKQDFFKLLDSTGDINAISKWIVNMANQGDEIGRIIDSMFKQLYHESRMEAEDDLIELRKIHDEYAEATGSNDTSFMFTEDGMQISNYDAKKYQRQLDLFVRNSLIANSNPAKRPKQVYIKEGATIRGIISEYMNANLDANGIEHYEEFVLDPTIEYVEKNLEIPQVVKDQFDMTAHTGKQDYLNYVFNNTDLHGVQSGTIKLSDEYKTDQDMKDLTPAQIEYYNKVMPLLIKADNMLFGHRLDGMMPQMEKEWLERTSVDGFIKASKEAFNDSWSTTIKDEDGATFSEVDERGNKLNLVPTYYTDKVEKDKMSKDATRVIAAFISRAHETSAKKSRLSLFEVIGDLVQNRVISEGSKISEKAKVKFGSLGSMITGTGEQGGNIAESLQHYYGINLYGVTATPMTMNLGNKEIRVDKVLGMFGKLTSTSALAFNLYAGIANPILGASLLFQEAVGGEHFDYKDLIHATAAYTNDMPDLFMDIGKVSSNSKLRLFSNQFDIHQDYDGKNTKEVSHSRVKKEAFDQSNLYIINHAGEHALYSVGAIAMANNIKLKDANGKEIGLYDAYEVVDGKLQIKEGITKEDGSKFTNKDGAKFSTKLAHFNQYLHGIYNSIDKPMLQKHAVGSLIMMFRKFMVPGILRRYKTEAHDYIYGYKTEGYYNTGFKWMVNSIKEMIGMQSDAMLNYDKMSRHQKANMFRFMTGAVQAIVAAGVAALLASGLDGDDDDSWLHEMSAYQARRLYSELTFYWSPAEFQRLLESPAAAVSIFDTILKPLYHLAGMINPFKDEDYDVFKTGKKKGKSKMLHYSLDAIPLWKTLSGISDPSEKLNFFNK